MSTGGSVQAAQTQPRIPPGSRADIGLVNSLIATAAGLATGGAPPHVFTTLARHRGLFRAWLRFASKLMPRGTLPRADTELVILRVAHNSGCDYEWHHHEQIAQTVGLSAGDVQRVRDGDTSGFSPRQALLLQTADELHAQRTISDELWAQLRERLSDVETIELCMLVGHYEMLAMTLNSLRVQPDPPARRVPLNLGRRRAPRSAAER